MTMRSPCLDCDKKVQDKNKCLESCEKLKAFQKVLTRKGTDARG